MEWSVAPCRAASLGHGPHGSMIRAMTRHVHYIIEHMAGKQWAGTGGCLKSSGSHLCSSRRAMRRQCSLGDGEVAAHGHKPSAAPWLTHTLIHIHSSHARDRTGLCWQFLCTVSQYLNCYDYWHQWTAVSILFGWSTLIVGSGGGRWEGHLASQPPHQLPIQQWGERESRNSPDSKVYRANMGHTWGQQDPGGPHVGPMNL